MCRRSPLKFKTYYMVNYTKPFVSLTTTAIAAIVVEYIQKKCGFIFDWLDALATVLLPGLITVFSILVVTL